MRYEKQTFQRLFFLEKKNCNALDKNDIDKVERV